MAKIAKSFRLEEEQINIVKNYPSSVRTDAGENYRLEEMLEGYSSLIEITKSELKGYLSIDEAWYIIDITNSHLYVPKHSPKSQLILEVLDADLYDGIASKWNIDLAAFKSKLEALTEFQAHIYFLASNEFWSLPDEHRNGPRKIEWVNKIFNI
jgi:hypothetical protein